ncbi:MAG TPA: serine hydroxymethyltransferase [Nitrososphaerales archaeon]|nr:serine hydroxymethyltransferase [Nitrososphaerales archaeon]
MSHVYLDRLERTIKQHEDWRLRECLNLIPSENHGSPLMRSMFMTDLGNRYSAPDKFYRGTRYVDEMTALSEEIARKVFNARYADVRPLSGHIANMIILMSLLEQGDKLLTVSPENGGYPGVSHEGLGTLFKLRNLYFPYDDATVNIDAKRAAVMMKSEEPNLAIFGASFIPFPQPTKQLSSASEGVKVFDGSHVLGLISGGEFQDPLREGCSLLIGSTHKSFPGPQGGIILSNNEEVFDRVSKKVFPGIVDNVHLNRVAALAIALLEMMQFGKAYAQAVVKNAQTLARSLVAEGVQVRGASQGYTKSHQVLLDYDPAKLKFISARLEQANIINDNGGRLGTSEATRMGYGPKEMELVAELIAQVVLGKKPVDFVQKRVKSLVKGFQSPKYVLQSVPKVLE